MLALGFSFCAALTIAHARSHAAREDEEIIRQLNAALATVPQGRLGVAQDCVGAYLFLASRALSAYIIGQVIEVNGGQLMP